ncbi:glycosyltransferase family 4 protein [Pseudoalteromonas distincta]|jgi:glycosyltransferase involved in cell wall biosynthesis|uniref:glycosyltransferase n=1 Tax=Pseudoalteromonas distincta TaxID=77608 RepID=UPI001190347E|nr:glycosyltransferase [Pseudoalteromonas elyakovii]TVU70832.1 glycosyltransferase family 4 protein [Pseudoalteromonas elyakovii]|tara:strand:+ start:3280 stop:4377 length:1098 start_codon:yes stop_codon:yes gene_type:complete
MKVLIIPYNYPTINNSQKAIFIADQVSMLREQGNDVTVLGAIPKTASEAIKSRCFRFGRLSEEKDVVSFPAIRGMDRLNNTLQLAIGKKLFQQFLLHNPKPNLVHVHNASCGALALWIKKNYDIPFVVTEHSSLKWKKLCEKSLILYKESKANIAVSNAFGMHLSLKYKQIFHYVPNVVDINFFKKADSGRITGACKTFVSIGNLTVNKNHQLAIRSVKSLLEKGYEVKLFIGGAGPEEQQLKKLIKSLNLQKDVFLLGQLSRLQIKDLLNRSDYFLLPSKKETFGVVLIEAMAAGLPVLALKNGGSESIVTPEVGLLAENEQCFIEKISLLLKMDFQKNAIFEYVYSKFSQCAVMKTLLKIYKI